MAKAGRGSDQFPLRLPDGLRDRIKEYADLAGRSMNAEIVATLEKAYPISAQVKRELTLIDEIDDIARKLEQRVRELRIAEEVAKGREEVKEVERLIDKSDHLLGKPKKK